jgi:hypothetical protein
VTFTLDRRHVIVEYPYGMSRTELESALRRVANSAKRVGAAQTIGRLGIGIFSFQQVGRRCTFFTRKTTLHSDFQQPRDRPTRAWPMPR